MPIRKLHIRVAVAGLALIFSPAYAGNFFVGTTLGQSEADDYELESVSTDLDDNDFAYRVFAGYRFNKYFAFGGSWVDLGELDARGNSLTEPNFTDNIEVDGLELWLAGILPVGDRWSFFGTVGGFSWNQDVTYRDDNGAFTGDSDGTDISYGLGANYAITDRLGIHAAYHGYPDVGKTDDTGHDNDWTFYGIGLTWLFGDVGEAAPAAAPVVAAAAPAPAPAPPPPPPPPADADGDGVVDPSDQCPDTPRGDRVGPQGCSCDITRQVQFALDSAELTAEGRVQLDEIVETLTRLKFVAGTVTGHTDASGSDAYNQRLSERRAQTVADYLQAKGIASGRLDISGAGESQPIADNATADGRAQNRRVVLRRTDCQ